MATLGGVALRWGAVVVMAMTACGGGDSAVPGSDAGPVEDGATSGDDATALVPDAATVADTLPPSDTRIQPDDAFNLPAGCDDLDSAVDLDGNGTPDCAETLAANAQFSTAIQSWGRSGPVTLEFQKADARGNPASGSLRAINTFVDARAGYNLSGPTQCVNVAAANQVTAFMQYRIPSAQTSHPRARLRLQFNDQMNCSGMNTQMIESPDQQILDAWTTLSLIGAVPAGTRSLRIVLVAWKSNPEPAAEVWFDNVLLRTAP